MNSNHFPQNEKIGFLRKTTLVDFPEHIACAVFLIGCNLRCPYCYNKDLVLLNKNSQKDDFFPQKSPKNKDYTKAQIY